MSLDRAAIDKMRAANNQEPISDVEFAALSGGDLSDEQKAENQRLAAEAETARLAEEEKNKQQVQKVEPTEAELLEMIAAKTGRKVASWDDLKPTAEIIDKEKAQEERENNKFTWGLQSKKIKKNEYEGYIADSKNPTDLVYRLRLQEALKEDANLDEKEFKEEFEEEFGITAEKVNPRRYKNGQNTLNRLANEILKSSYGSIYDLEKNYSQYESEQSAASERENKIKDGAPAFKKTLDTVKSQLKKIKTQIGEGEEYEVEMLDESIDRVVNMMSDPTWASQQILNGYTEESIKDIAWTAVLKENFPFIAHEIKKQALLKHAAGTKGIVKLNTGGNGDQYELTEQQQTLKNIIEGEKAKSAVAAN